MRARLTAAAIAAAIVLGARAPVATAAGDATGAPTTEPRSGAGVATDPFNRR